jgi:hypothetical protein
MRTSRISIAAAAIAGTALLCGQTPTFVPATKETESKFFRAFDPTPLLDKAGLGCEPNGNPAPQVTLVASGETHAAGDSRDNVHHTRNIEPWFCGDVVKNAALMAAIDNGVISSLQHAACILGEHQLTTEDGLRLTYRCGDRTQGTLTVKIKPSDDPKIDIESTLEFHIEETYSVRR